MPPRAREGSLCLRAKTSPSITGCTYANTGPCGQLHANTGPCGKLAGSRTREPGSCFAAGHLQRAVATFTAPFKPDASCHIWSGGRSKASPWCRCQGAVQALSAAGRSAGRSSIRTPSSIRVASLLQGTMPGSQLRCANTADTW
jgi:hypothetical protein